MATKHHSGLEPYTIANFKPGLDVRRSELTSQPGTLLRLIDAHINEGAEIEKRKSLVQFVNINDPIPNISHGYLVGDQLTVAGGTPIVSAQLVTVTSVDLDGGITGVALSGAMQQYSVVPTSPNSPTGGTGTGAEITFIIVDAFVVNPQAVFNDPGCLGMQATSNGLVTFGHANPYGGAAPALSALLPAGISYVQCQHPAVAQGVAYDRTLHRMVEVTSTSFGGQPYAVATFADGSTFEYFNGVLVLDSVNGLVLAGLTSALAIANQFIANIQQYKWVEILNSSGPPDVVTFGAVTAGVGVDDTVTFSFTTTDSNNTMTFTSNNLHGGNASASPQVGFYSFSDDVFAREIASGNVITITARNDTNSATVYLLTNYTIPNGLNTFGIISAIAAAINAAAVQGYTAVSGGVLVLSGPAGNTALNGTVSSIAVTGGNTYNGTLQGGGASTNYNSQCTNTITRGTYDWTVGAAWTVTAASVVSGQFITLGKGNLAGQSPTCCLTYNNKVYLGSGAELLFSGVGTAIGYEQQDVGAGTLNFLQYSPYVDAVVGLAAYQGRLAVFGSNNIQIWAMDANPANNQLTQTLLNTGTIAGLSCVGLGDIDVLYLNNTGYRSLRVRDSSLNAYVADIGSPIDQLVQADVLAAAVPSAACSITDPQTGRYWGFVNSKIYVLSYYPNTKIAAWSTYTPIDNMGVNFVPVKFDIYGKQVYVLGSDNIIRVYGGTNNNTYDTTQPIVVLPWQDMRHPSLHKRFASVDIAIAGGWTLYGSAQMNLTAFKNNVPEIWYTLSNALIQLVQITDSDTITEQSALFDSTFDNGVYAFQDVGTHFCLCAVGQAVAQPLKLASITVMFSAGQTN